MSTNAPDPGEITALGTRSVNRREKRVERGAKRENEE